MNRDRTTAAELLLDLADSVRYPKCILAMRVDSMPDYTMARIRTALDFEHRSKVFKLRAIVEQWSFKRLVREMY